MKILTLDNRTYKLEKIPEWVDENLRFAVLVVRNWTLGDPGTIESRSGLPGSRHNCRAAARLHQIDLGGDLGILSVR